VLAGSIDFDPDPHFPRARLLTMDRVSQFALVAGREAMAQAGLGTEPGTCPTAPLRTAFGVSLGTGSGGAGSTEAAYTALLEQKVARLRPMTVVLAMNNAIAAHVSMEFGLKGPSSTVSNACASSATSIGEAFRQIRHGYADAMLAGGSEALLNRGTIKAWQAMHTLAKPHADGAETSCRPFSADRTGLVLAEGAAMLVLEEWESAKRRGANILAELCGYASTTDAHHLTQPDAQGQARAMTLALEDAKLQASDIGYLNAHGTATDVGDVVETSAIKLAFQDLASRLPDQLQQRRARARDGRCGRDGIHRERDGPARRAIATHGIPENPDPRCDLDYVPLAPRDAKGLRAVMSNSFAFGGSNAVLIAKSA
jgi:3-oxoacyl-(acyl-carrier-protein) synthase